METSNLVCVFPSISTKRAWEATQRWHDAGYKVGILMESGAENIGADYFINQPKWQGFPKAANLLCRSVKEDVVIVAGDDVHPDKTHTPLEILAAFIERFPTLMGVMQPTGDKYGSWQKCAVSPWIGRRFIESCGPYYEGYYHYFCDEELQARAELLGCFWQREDLIQYHDHWQRNKLGRPSHLLEANRRWQDDKRRFESRKRMGFRC